MGRGKRMLGTPRPASEKTPGHREEKARALAVGTLVTPGQVAISEHSLTHIHSFIHHPTLGPFNKFTLSAF